MKYDKRENQEGSTPAISSNVKSLIDTKWKDSGQITYYRKGHISRDYTKPNKAKN